MADVDPSARSAPPTGRLAPPRYTGGRGGSETWAHFDSGASVPCATGRARAYPGLPGPAPSTLPFYRAFAAALGRTSTVIDAGCGSGVGSAVLRGAAGRVLAVDEEPRALAFAREYARGVETVRSSLTEPLPGVRADAAVVADVLGHVRDPIVFLGSLRASLDPQARILIAEPTAFVAQRLTPPVRRAFTQRSLEALLVRSGLRVQAWVADTGTFIACVAAVADCAAAEHFLAAAAAKDDPTRALAAIARAAISGRLDVQREAAIAEAELHVARLDGDAAARAFIRAAELDGADPRPVAGLSMLALRSGDQTHAVQLASRAAELDPTEPASAIAMAEAMDQLSPREAFHAYRIAERLAPDHLGVATRLAALSADRGDYALGIAAFERIRAYGDPLPMEFHVTMALLLLAEGRRGDALLELRLARTIDPTHAGVCELWAELNADVS